MSDTVRESLSALMDGEASELELRRILSSDDEYLRSQWSDFHRSQNLLKGEKQSFADLDISSRVMAAIEAEALPNSGMSQWRQVVSGLAVAASVAAVVVVGSIGSNMFSGSKPMIADNGVSGRVYPGQAAPAVGSVAVSAQAQSVPAGSALGDDAEARKRFEAYLRKHTDRAAFNNGQGMVSYARVVSQESK
jgi:sigma-E factor negative regulatory protein RseA